MALHCLTSPVAEAQEPYRMRAQSCVACLEASSAASADLSAILTSPLAAQDLSGLRAFHPLCRLASLSSYSAVSYPSLKPGEQNTA